MLKKVDHIGIAVPSIDDALVFYRDGLGMELVGTEEVASQKVKVAFLPAGETNIELLEGTDDTSNVSKFVAKNGPGTHHICFEVEDIDAALASLKARGVRLINEEPVRGAHGKRVAFIHPKGTGGVLVELAQKGE